MNQLISIENVVIRQDGQGLYCLNDFHKAAGSLHTKRPSIWLATNQAQELIQELSPYSDLGENTGNGLSQNSGLGQNIINVIKGGVNPGTYVCKELVYAYAMWISPAFNLKVIRTFDSIVTRKSSEVDKINIGLMILESAARTLNLSNSAKLKGYQELQKYSGVPSLLPNYAIDAPSDAVDGTSRVSYSLTHLLKQFNVPINTSMAYALLKELGVVVRNQRKSIKKDVIKEFWSVTSYGLLYGKNVTSPHNPRETQPHFYETRFKELLKLMQNAKAA